MAESSWFCAVNSSPQHYDFDVAIIGGGSAGYAAANAAAGFGLKTVVIEGGREVGGLCILRGCMPTKALLHAAEVLHTARKSALWGLAPKEISFAWERVLARKDRLIAEFAQYRSAQLASGKFEFIRSMAAFDDPHTIRLENGGRLTAANFILATGSKVAPGPWPELQQLGCLSSDEALHLRALPRSIIILGGGAVAVEFAQIFARFDVEVTLVQRSSHLLHEFEPEAAEELEQALVREGIHLHTGTKITGFRRHEGKKVVSFVWRNQSVETVADEIFNGLGRRGNIAGLGLERAGVAAERDWIRVDSKLRTSAPHIFAAGDCTSPDAIVHVAVRQGEIAAWNIAHPSQPKELDQRLRLHVVFTQPRLAAVGLDERAARAQQIPFLAASYRFADHGKSMIQDELDGFVKLLANPESGEILGGSVVGPQGGELIHEIVAAMQKRMTVHELAAMPHYHPTLAEIWTYPAEELAGQITGGK